MTVAPPRRRSRIVFWIAALAIVSAIAATALLANDKRNLRAIAERYHIGWLNFAPTIPPRQPPPARHTRPITVSPAVGKPVPPRMFSNLQAVPSTFLRHWKISGETVCDRLGQAGIAIGRWKQGDLDSSTFECSYETPISETAISEQPSLFVIVRGTSDGDVANVRIKAILPDTPAGADLNRQFQALVRVLVQETQWHDLDDAVAQIEKLQNVTQSAFGAKLVFSHEFANPRRFNLILDLDKPTRDQIATAAFFDTSKRFSLPEAPAER
jgi:Family of unknown function (DUF6030)